MKPRVDNEEHREDRSQWISNHNLILLLGEVFVGYMIFHPVKKVMISNV